MNSIQKCLSLLIFSVLVSASSALAQAPRIFFTDLTSGPNAGGENVSGFSGAYVTIYGNFFGTSQGSSTITLSGVNCLRVVSWGTSWLWYQKIVVQLGSGCSTGHFIVTVSGKANTNATITLNGSTLDPSLFTVRSGNIHCVSTSGNDSNSGSFASSCWSTIQHAIQSEAAGDITYVENGVSENASCIQYNAALCILSQGSAGNPKAIVAYPAATVTVDTTQEYSLRTPAVSGPGPYWTIAGVNFVNRTANGESLSVHQPNFRVVGNTLQCPDGNEPSACYEVESDGTSTGDQIYGNQWSNVGFSGSMKTYHALYFSLDADHMDVGWNDIHGVQGCRAIQWFDSTGHDAGDLHVHDNLIHNVRCDGINMNGVNPDEAGGVEVFNNVEYSVGTGPDPSDGAAIYTCLNLNSNQAHTGSVQYYNNTCYNAGDSSTVNSSQSGAISAYIPVVLRNNLVYQNNGQPYLTTDAGCSQVANGSTKNEWFANGVAPTCSGLSGSLNVDPKIISTSTPDFHLQSGSPMIDSGVAISSLTSDHDGVQRPQGPAYDIGAYEFVTTSLSRPAPPTGLTVVVH